MTTCICGHEEEEHKPLSGLCLITACSCESYEAEEDVD